MAQIFAPNAQKLRWIHVEGPDAKDFLHRLTTANLRGLAVGDGTPACFLNPQGRIVSYFKLWRTGETRFALETEQSAETLAIIDQFTFGEKMTVSEAQDVIPLWVLPAEGERIPNPAGATGAPHCLSEGNVVLCFQGQAELGRPWVSAWGPEAEARAHVAAIWPSATLIDETAVERLRIEAMWPRAGHEISAESNPLEIGLRSAIADNKGCYPGQEVLEKIIALGAPARRLALLSVQGALEQGTPLLDDAGNEQGRITSIAAPDLALAILRKTHAKEGGRLHTATGAHATVARISTYE